jgi:hypothetical protein
LRPSVPARAAATPTATRSSEEVGNMAADVPAIRRWLLDEVRTLQQQQESARIRLMVLRSIMRLIADSEAAIVWPAPEDDS